MWFFAQLCSSWQDFNWRSASRGPSAMSKLRVLSLHASCSKLLTRKRLWGGACEHVYTESYARLTGACFVRTQPDAVDDWRHFAADIQSCGWTRRLCRARQETQGLCVHTLHGTYRRSARHGRFERSATVPFLEQWTAGYKGQPNKLL